MLGTTTSAYPCDEDLELWSYGDLEALIRKCIEAQEHGADHIVAWGDGSPTRVYVADAAEGIVLAADRYNRSDPVNLGSAYEISIKDLPELIARLIDFEG
ncbi:MAG TPA: hypothetical protein VGD69_03980 [Herpetosiphonaceae bacterium]